MAKSMKTPIKVIMPLCYMIICLSFSCSQPSYKEQKAKTFIDEFVTAISVFHQTYGYYPVSTDRVQDTDLRVVLPVLLALPESPEANKLNPQRSKFFDISPGNFHDGEYLDPWGSPYHLVLDVDNVGKVKVGAKWVNKKIVVWSNGSNKINEYGNGDDLNCWR